jgi:hypothetical protein
MNDHSVWEPNKKQQDKILFSRYYIGLPGKNLNDKLFPLKILPYLKGKDY